VAGMRLADARRCGPRSTKNRVNASPQIIGVGRRARVTTENPVARWKGSRAARRPPGRWWTGSGPRGRGRPGPRGTGPSAAIRTVGRVAELAHSSPRGDAFEAAPWPPPRAPVHRCWRPPGGRPSDLDDQCVGLHAGLGASRVRGASARRTATRRRRHHPCHQPDRAPGHDYRLRSGATVAPLRWVSDGSLKPATVGLPERRRPARPAPSRPGWRRRGRRGREAESTVACTDSVVSRTAPTRSNSVAAWPTTRWGRPPGARSGA